VERRLAAILAADVVGYSRLMGADEAGTLAALNALRAELVDPKIVGQKGRIFKTTGDGIMAEFPSVVNAVACAVDIQRGIQARNADLPEERAIRLRIGVNVGDVIVESEDIFGDGDRRSYHRLVPERRTVCHRAKFNFRIQGKGVRCSSDCP
jgi:adenylate cyclase